MRSGTDAIQSILGRRHSNPDQLADNTEVPVLFDADWYSGQTAIPFDLAADAYDHYRTIGVAHGADPHPLFDSAYYRTKVDLPDTVDPLAHFLEGPGAVSPHPAFDGEWYLEKYPDVADAGVNALVHYLFHGSFEGRNPSCRFFSSWYLDQNPDVADAGMNPLLHYVVFGQDEGRQPSPLVGLDTQNVLTRTGLVSGTFAAEAPPRLIPTSEGFELPDGDATAELVSIDCWDTLLFRRCHPESTKLASARFLLFSGFRWLEADYQSVVRLYQQRLAAERHTSRGPDGEYRFDEAARNWVDHVVAPQTSAEIRQELTTSLLAHEIEFETSVTFPNRSIVPILKRYRDKMFCLTSDFYLGEHQLMEIVRANGIESRFDRVLVSCDVGISKRSGQLFDHVLDGLDEEGDIDVSNVLHIGDNPQADVVAAEGKGITTALHRVSRPEELSDAVNGYLSDNPDTYIPILEAVIRSRHDETPEAAANEMLSLGVRLAPIFVGFVLNVAEECIRQGRSRVVFSTREGQILQELYELVRTRRPYGVDLPPSTCLELSRVATFGPSLRKLSLTELRRLWTMYPNQSPRALLRSLGMETPDLLEQFEKAGFSSDRVVETPWENDEFLALIRSPQFVEEVVRRLDQSRSCLNGYLLQEGFKGGDDLFVEIGWRGTIQDNLSHLLGKPLSGVYLGLFSFLNPQPDGSRKLGWIFDDNQDLRESSVVNDVGPLEMLLGAVGGSVTGHFQSDDHDGTYMARRKIVPDEEAVLSGPVSDFQRGLLVGSDALIEAAATHALTSEHFRGVARSMVHELSHRPPKALARLYFGYAHNEIFGTGAVDPIADFAADVDPITGHESTAGCLTAGESYRSVQAQLERSRWPSGAAALLSDRIATDGDLNPHVPTSVFVRVDGISVDGSVAIFAPPPMAGSGGHLTIYHLTRALAAAGLDVTLLFEDLGNGTNDAIDFFRGSGVRIESSWDRSAYYDYVVATVDYSAPYVLGIPAGGHGYLVQDFEALFNPIGDRYAAAEISYLGDFDFLCVGNWLGHVLGERFGQPAFCAGLGADHTIYRDLRSERERAVCFLYQPEKPRRATRLGLDALRYAQERDPHMKVYFYGSDAPIPKDIRGESLGLIKDQREINALYNKASVGLCISMSNPSRIPYEMMAAGMVPVDVYRYNNMFDYDDGTSVLCLQSPGSLGAAINMLLDSPETLTAYRERCHAFISNRLRRWETDAMVNVILARVSGLSCRATTPAVSYTNDGYVGPADLRTGADRFCAFQRAMASTGQSHE